VKQAVQLLAAGLALSWCVNVRLPAATPVSAWLSPSADIAVLLAVLALFGPGKLRVWSWLCCATLLSVRVARIADGVCERYLDRRFHLAVDLPLLPEFVRLAISTLGPLRFALALSTLALGLALLWWVLRESLQLLTHALAEPRFGDHYLIAAGALALLGPYVAPSGSFYTGYVTPRVLGELEQWLTARGWFDDPARAEQRKQFEQRFSVGQQQLSEAAKRLQGPGVDVHLLLVEAYGRTVQSTPLYAQQLAPSYQAFADQIAAAGFSVCTSFVRATILGGSSWLTHATIQSGVAVYDQFEFEVLLERGQLSSLAQSFRQAGYRSVSVKPGTTRTSPLLRIYGFDTEYTANDLDYRGRRYAWAPMPDQFVLQRIAERELQNPVQPLFLEYALVSSHFPFNPRPPYIDDWNSLGDGSVFNRMPALDYDTDEVGVFAYPLGYLDSLRYELRVIGTFLGEHVRDDALVIIVGDHQPVGPVAGGDQSRYTPLHALTRRAALLDPLRARGCVPGMHGGNSEPQLTMEDLGATLLMLASQASGG